MSKFEWIYKNDLRHLYYLYNHITNATASPSFYNVIEAPHAPPLSCRYAYQQRSNYSPLHEIPAIVAKFLKFIHYKNSIYNAMESMIVLQKSIRNSLRYSDLGCLILNLPSSDIWITKQRVLMHGHQG